MASRRLTCFVILMALFSAHSGCAPRSSSHTSASDVNAPEDSSFLQIARCELTAQKSRGFWPTPIYRVTLLVHPQVQLERGTKLWFYERRPGSHEFRKLWRTTPLEVEGEPQSCEQDARLCLTATIARTLFGSLCARLGVEPDAKARYRVAASIGDNLAERD